MRECRGVTCLGFFLVGAGVGAALALLLAPTSGAETRKYVSRRAEDGKDYLAGKGKNLRKQAQGALDKGKGLASRFAH
jgi:gas vesicle protein